jgi:hypothetical protein
MSRKSRRHTASWGSECRFKIRYRTAAKAGIARNSLQRDRGERLQVYCCSWCGSFHIGHKKGKEPKI